MENKTDALKNAVRIEQCVLSCISEDPNLIASIDDDLAPAFLLPDHAALWRVALELHGEGLPLDAAEWPIRARVDPDYIGQFMASGAVLALFSTYIRELLRFARERRKTLLLEELPNASDLRQLEIARHLEEVLIEPCDGDTVRKYADIPEIQCLDLPPVECIVPALGIARNTITLWSGPDGDGKTALADAMAVAVALGEEFLGMRCPECPILYLDLENPAGAIQARIRAMVGEQSIPTLRIWGKWNSQQPPEYGNPLLVTICKETRPLLIVDPFRYFHGAEENDSGEMSAVMKYLRNCASVGASVVLLHHPARSEGSTGRGSTAIRAACDLAFIHSLDKETGLITLKVDKNRNGERRSFTIRPDFEQCTFELTESAWVQLRNDELTRLREIISKNPGASTSQLAERFGGRKTRLLKLLEEGLGTQWNRELGPRGARVYIPIDGTRSLFLPKGREQGNRSRNALAVPGTSGNGWEQETGGIRLSERANGAAR